MRARLVLLLLLVCSANSAFAAVSVFDGVFIHPATGRGIPGARVKLLKINWGFPFQRPPTSLAMTRTDGQGRSHFVTSSPGPYELSCYSRRGRVSGIQQEKRPTTSIRIVGFVLPPPPDLRPPPPKKT